MTWIWQGFEGDTALVNAAKAQHDLLPDNVVGLMMPERGMPAMPWNLTHTRAMYAVLVREDGRLPCPSGLEEASPALVGRLVNA